jgi:hypothetical protein
VNIGKWWIALPAVLLLTGFSLARPGAASAMPASQDLSYAYNAASFTLTVSTDTGNLSDMPTLTLMDLKVDGTIQSDACTPSVGLPTSSAACVFSGITAHHSISFGAMVQDSSGVAGKTKVHCQRVDADGCSGTKSLNLH